MTTTKTTIALAELAEKGANVDLVREMIRHIAHRSACAGAFEREQAEYQSKIAAREEK